MKVKLVARVDGKGTMTLSLGSPPSQMYHIIDTYEHCDISASDPSR